jgi:hypothetical protein
MRALRKLVAEVRHGDVAAYFSISLSIRYRPVRPHFEHLNRTIRNFAAASPRE